MPSLKYYYCQVASAYAKFFRNTSQLEQVRTTLLVNHVSREVRYYRDHFFNLKKY